MLPWRGGRFGLPNAMSAATGGYRRWRNHRCARANPAGQRYGTSTAWTAGRRLRRRRSGILRAYPRGVRRRISRQGKPNYLKLWCPEGDLNPHGR
jgi:hypothetical protein